MIGVVIATYGDRDEWTPFVHRAAESVDRQDAGLVARIWYHGDDLTSARNEGAKALIAMDGDDPVDWLIFLDADDELDDDYINTMRAAVDQDSAIYRPNTQGFHEDGTIEEPRMIPRTDMRKRNCAVIGTMVPAALFEEVGGFDPYPCLEDWELWIRMLKAGAVLVDVPDAIYRVHVREGSRNAPNSEMNAVYRDIRRKHADWCR